MKIQIKTNRPSIYFYDPNYEEDGSSNCSSYDPYLLSQNDQYERYGSWKSRCCLTPLLTVLIILTMSISAYFVWIILNPLPLISIGTIQITNWDQKKYHIDISWSNCGKNTYGKLNELKVTPNPISLNNNLTFSLDAEIFQDLNAPLSVKIKFEKKVWGEWIPIPCFNSFGSCTIRDICQLTPYIHNKSCILPLPHSFLPCNCPIKKGQYFAHNSTVPLVDPAKFLPKWLKNGHYWARVNGFSSKTELGCYQFFFAVRS